ncbi:Rho termination factor N-terminal domain-containing protein [Haploplasma modicum]|uniref:Rho termination factor N-terminal domain-containing protein n=1 Tax=Haploplasma modicum TaxID=2150 RepID=UPI0005524DB2|nr:Rho termination factor N-terminal domain-containing protein [Haploplasma modicum]
MKMNNKVFKYLTGEPFLVQELNGKQVELHYMNDTPFLQQYVPRGRFYIWSSDGRNYKLLIEKGFYEKMDYFFKEEINEVWLNYLDEISEMNSKMSRIFLLGSMGLSLVIIVLATLFLPEDKLFLGIIAALVITFIGNAIHSRKANAQMREKNDKAQMQIKELLTEEGFRKLLKDQEEYMKEYFKFEEDEEVEVLDDEEVLEIEENAQAEDQILEEENIQEEVEVEVIEKPKAKKINYEAMTVAELKDMARSMELKGYSSLTKQDLIKLIKKNNK